MPHVHNGIGTWYYGKKNKQTRQGVCGQCGQSATLTTYDTRLYVVFLMIPVFPLGKKHIIDDCSRCRRHRVAKLADWEIQKKKSIDEALAKMATDPTDPKLAIELHRNYLYFGQQPEAEKLLAFMKEHFAEDAKTQFYIGAALEYLGRGKEATVCFERALQLDPAMAEAKRAVGMGFAEQGRLDEARAMLKYLEEPEGSGAKDPALVYTLGCAFQKAKRNAEALDLFGIAMRQSPALAQNATFRKTVKTCEKDLGLKQSILPARKYNRAKIVGWSLAAAAVVLIALGINIYISYARKLHIVTGYSQPVTVSIDGGAGVTLDQPYPTTVPISEGKHHVVLTGAVKDEFDIELSSGFFQRFFSSPLFVLNPGGARLLIYETTQYSAHPVIGAGGRTQRYAFGQQFSTFSDVDFAFMPFPHTITLDSHSSSVTRSRVGAVDEHVADVVYDLWLRGKKNDAIEMAEWRLRVHPDDTRTLDSYIFMSHDVGQGESARVFVKAGCKRRPVEIPWHLAWQRMNSIDTDALEREYDSLLKAEPENTSLQYLRALLYTNDAESDPIFERVIEKAPGNPWPHYTLGHHLMCRGDWSAAKAHLEKACQLDPDNSDFTDVLYEIRFALAEYSTLETELREQLILDTTNMDINKHLCDCLVALGKKKDAQAVANAFATAMRAANDSMGLGDNLTQYVMYACGDFGLLEKTAPPGSDLRLHALFELSKLNDIVTEHPLANADDPTWCLIMSAGFKFRHDDAAAKAWREKGIELLGKGNRHSFQTAAVLRRNEPSPIDDVTNLHLEPRQLALMFALLAMQFPEKAHAYKTIGQKLNVDLAFPHHFLVDALAEK